MKKRIVFLLLICSSIAFSQEKYTVKSNIPYYETQSQDVYQNERCVLDIYYPQNAKNFATIVWFHGGGLTSGSKEIPEALKNKGYCIIGVNYRLSPKAKAPAYIEDAAVAVAWTFKNIEKYGGNSNSIFVSGHSAGGYLTAMVGLDKKWLQAHQIDANKIAGLIPFSCQAITHFTIRSENGISDTQPIVDQYAPLFHVRKDAPPLLLITGDRELEMLGRYEENAYFMRMMKVVGHTETKLLELDRYDHGGMAQPAFPILIKEMRRILDLSK